MRDVEERAETVLASAPSYVWDGELLPVPVEDIVDSVFGLLVRGWEDDMFTPLTSKVKVHSPTADLNGKVGGPAVTSQRMFWWKQHGGHYEIHFEWALRRVV